jgi:predicted Fe-Mo cluster-binding NifX family protein
MKIAVPARGNLVDEHFGHCERYILYAVDENNKIAGTEVIEAATGCGCKSGIAPVLASKGVSVMLAGNIGSGAVNVLAQSGIAVCRGCSGEALSVAEAFLAGSLNDSGLTCGMHGHNDQGHECHNH